MDVQEIITKVEGMLGDDAFKKALSSDPAKAIEKALGITISADQLTAVLNAIKGKVDLGDVAKVAAGAAEGKGVEGIVKEVEEKIGGEGIVKEVEEKLGGEGIGNVVKEAEEKIEGLLGGILGKK